MNEAARKLWPSGENPIGRRVRLDVLENPRGVLVPPVASAPMSRSSAFWPIPGTRGLRNPPSPAIFVPYSLIAPTGRMLAVRTRGDPMLLLNAVRQSVACD